MKDVGTRRDDCCSAKGVDSEKELERLHQGRHALRSRRRCTFLRVRDQAEQKNVEQMLTVRVRAYQK